MNKMKKFPKELFSEDENIFTYSESRQYLVSKNHPKNTDIKNERSTTSNDDDIILRKTLVIQNLNNIK
jgi:hypothetical protein